MRTVDELRKEIKRLEAMRDSEDFRGQTDELRRHLTLESALHAADELLTEGSDGSVEEADYLASALMLKLAERVHLRNQSNMLRRDILR
jgi:hypothetical protein